MDYVYMNGELYHHGIIGQKWGVRRYQNEDGSLTPAGMKRYGNLTRQIGRSENLENRVMTARSKNRSRIEKRYDKRINALEKDRDSFNGYENGIKNKKGKEVLSKEDVKTSVDALNKRIEKMQASKKYTLADYDFGTKAVKSGYKQYQKVIKDYQNAKISALEDKVYKHSSEYKEAVRNYSNQVMYNWINYGGSAATVMNYAGNYARANYDEFKRNNPRPN